MKPRERATRRKAERRGRRAEGLALFRLLLKGYWPLAQRVKTPVGEIDLIARGWKKLIFVEVKQRPDEMAGLLSISERGKTRMARAAQWWLARHPSFAHEEMRFDLVVVTRFWLPRHYPGFFDF